MSPWASLTLALLAFASSSILGCARADSDAVAVRERCAGERAGGAVAVLPVLGLCGPEWGPFGDGTVLPPEPCGPGAEVVMAADGGLAGLELRGMPGGDFSVEVEAAITQQGGEFAAAGVAVVDAQRSNGAVFGLVLAGGGSFVGLARLVANQIEPRWENRLGTGVCEAHLRLICHGGVVSGLVWRQGDWRPLGRIELAPGPWRIAFAFKGRGRAFLRRARIVGGEAGRDAA